MSRTSATIAIALVLYLAVPVASFAYMAGEAGSGNLPISGIPPGPVTEKAVTVYVSPSTNGEERFNQYELARGPPVILVIVGPMKS